jgi:hypothetical protein
VAPAQDVDDSAGLETPLRAEHERVVDQVADLASERTLVARRSGPLSEGVVPENVR